MRQQCKDAACQRADCYDGRVYETSFIPAIYRRARWVSPVSGSARRPVGKACRRGYARAGCKRIRVRLHTRARGHAERLDIGSRAGAARRRQTDAGPDSVGSSARERRGD